MAVDTKPDSELNPSQEDYDKKFNDIVSAESTATFDSESRKTENASEINEKESTSTGRQGFYNQSAGGGLKGRFSSKKKKGPIAAIIGLVVGGGLGMGVMFSPSLLLVHMKETLFDALNDSGPAMNIRTNKLLWKKANYMKAGFQQSSFDKCNIKCKFGTINETTKRNFEKRGFVFDEASLKKNRLGRYTYGKVTFPSGDVVESGDDWIKALRKYENAKSFKSVYNSRTAYFLNSRFGSMLRTKLGLDRLTKVAGETKEKAIASLRSSLGLEGASRATDPNINKSKAERMEKRYPKILEKVNSVKGKFRSGLGTAAAVCTAYDVGKVFSWGVKMAKYAAFAAFAISFLNIADKIKSGDNPEPAAVSALGDILTTYSTDPNNANYKKSATDSAGYKMAAYGDVPSQISENDKQFSLIPNGALFDIIGTLVSYLTSLFVISAFTLAAGAVICGAANNIFLSFLAECADEIIELISTVGLSLILNIATCAGGIILGVVAIAGIALLIQNAFTSFLQDSLPDIDETTIGADAGNVIYSGTATIMGTTAAGYGMKAGTKDEIEQYALDTASEVESQIAYEIEDAKSRPFDISTKYSFLGSIFNKLGVFSLSNTSANNILGFIGSFTNRSFNASIPSASAAINTAVRKASQYDNKCNDPSLNAIGVDGDSFCNPSYVMSNKELQAENDDVVDYMINNGYINEDTGEVIPDESNKYYLYMTYCADRTDPLGDTALPIANGSLSSLNPADWLFTMRDVFQNKLDIYGWQVGSYCVEKSEMLSNFRTYTMDKSVNDTLDEYEN